MAKYDTYTVTKVVGSETRPTTRSLTVLFEDGDSIPAEMFKAENLFISVELPGTRRLIGEIESLSEDLFSEVLLEVLKTKSSEKGDDKKNYEKDILKLVKTAFDDNDDNDDDD